MAAFVFEFEAVLEQRGREEKLHQRAVAELEHQRVLVETRVESIKTRLSHGRESMRRALGAGGAVPMDAVRLQSTSSLHDLIALQRAALELAGVHQRLNAARARLMRATVARKAVETLRSRRYQAWRREQARIENNAMDDLAVMRHGRRADAVVGLDEPGAAA
ncbi:MAG: flagellar export protein FliJ [Phycisphaeraceae bacterium]|nr:flagellar export protein FliJ [Phycisphaeraceae bacterium]